MKEIESDTQLQEIHDRGQGFVFNDFSGLGKSGTEYNILHKASCSWVLKSNINVHKIFFENEVEAIDWLDAKRRANWKPCKTCKPIINKGSFNHSINHGTKQLIKERQQIPEVHGNIIKIEKDIEKGSKLAELLYTSFSTRGIHGQTDMPEDIISKGIEKGTLEHILFITLSVSLDYQRDAPALWASSRRTFEDSATRYLFDPKSLHESSLEKIVKDMQKYKLSKKPQKDADIWRTIGDSFYSKWAGDPRKFLQDCNWDSTIILDRLKKDSHLDNNKKVPDFPYIRGSKIGPLWLRMLRDNAGISNLVKLEKVPIPVDIHIARATLATGIVKGKGAIGFNELFEHIRKAWSESVKDIIIKNRPMIALDVDEPLWLLSKYGCTNRDKITGNCPVQSSCEVRDFCVKGKIKIDNISGIVEMET